MHVDVHVCMVVVLPKQLLKRTLTLMNETMCMDGHGVCVCRCLIGAGMFVCASSKEGQYVSE